MEAGIVPMCDANPATDAWVCLRRGASPNDEGTRWKRYW